MAITQSLTDQISQIAASSARMGFLREGYNEIVKLLMAQGMSEAEAGGNAGSYLATAVSQVTGRAEDPAVYDFAASESAYNAKAAADEKAYIAAHYNDYYPAGSTPQVAAGAGGLSQAEIIEAYQKKIITAADARSRLGALGLSAQDIEQKLAASAGAIETGGGSSGGGTNVGTKSTAPKTFEELMRRQVENEERNPFARQFGELFDTSRTPGGAPLSSALFNFLAAPAQSAYTLAPFLPGAAGRQKISEFDELGVKDFLGGGFGQNLQGVPGPQDILGAVQRMGGGEAGMTEAQLAAKKLFGDPLQNRPLFETVAKPFLSRVPSFFREMFGDYMESLMNQYQAVNKGRSFLGDFTGSASGDPALAHIRRFLGA